MRFLVLVLLLTVPPIAVAAPEQTKAAAMAKLKSEERALRKELGAGPSEADDMDLDGNRFGIWQALAENLAKQGRVAEAIEAMYDGAAEMPTRSADLRATQRWAMSEAVRFEEKLKGPSARTAAAIWGAAMSVQRGRSPVDWLEAGAEPFANGYLNQTIRRLTAIGRHDEASALASGAMGIATSFRLKKARADVQAQEVQLYRDRSWAMRTMVRTAYTLATTMNPAIDAALTAGEAALRQGDAAGAERRFRAFLATQPEPIVVSRFRLRATIGLIRALRAQQKGAMADQLRNELLGRLRWQTWADGPEIAEVRKATA